MRPKPVIATTLFCEDIREEVSGTYSIIGVMPDNVEIPSHPEHGGLVPRLACYFRISFDPSAPPAQASTELRWETTGATVLSVPVDRDVIHRLAADISEQGFPLATAFNTLISANFPVPDFGRLLAIVKWGDEEILTGAINFKPVVAEPGVGFPTHSSAETTD